MKQILAEEAKAKELRMHTKPKKVPAPRASEGKAPTTTAVFEKKPRSRSVRSKIGHAAPGIGVAVAFALQKKCQVAASILEPVDEDLIPAYRPTPKAEVCRKGSDGSLRPKMSIIESSKPINAISAEKTPKHVAPEVVLEIPAPITKTITSSAKVVVLPRCNRDSALQAPLSSSSKVAQPLQEPAENQLNAASVVAAHVGPVALSRARAQVPPVVLAPTPAAQGIVVDSSFNASSITSLPLVSLSSSVSLSEQPAPMAEKKKKKNRQRSKRKSFNNKKKQAAAEDAEDEATSASDDVIITGEGESNDLGTENCVPATEITPTIAAEEVLAAPSRKIAVQGKSKKSNNRRSRGTSKERKLSSSAAPAESMPLEHETNQFISRLGRQATSRALVKLSTTSCPINQPRPPPTPAGVSRLASTSTDAAPETAKFPEMVYIGKSVASGVPLPTLLHLESAGSKKNVPDHSRSGHTAQSKEREALIRQAERSQRAYDQKYAYLLPENNNNENNNCSSYVALNPLLYGYTPDWYGRYGAHYYKYGQYSPGVVQYQGGTVLGYPAVPPSVHIHGRYGAYAPSAFGWATAYHAYNNSNYYWYGIPAYPALGYATHGASTAQ